MNERIQIKIGKKNEIKLEELRRIYNIAVNSKLIEHLIDLELQRYGLNIKKEL